MQNVRWVNRHHPQTLYIGVILLYIDAALLLLFGAIASGLWFLIAAASVLAGLGIANDKRIAWYAGVAVSAISVLMLARNMWNDGLGEFDLNSLINAVFPIAQLTALVHPISRSYTRVYFE